MKKQPFQTSRVELQSEFQVLRQHIRDFPTGQAHIIRQHIRQVINFRLRTAQLSREKLMARRSEKLGWAKILTSPTTTSEGLDRLENHNFFPALCSLIMAQWTRVAHGTILTTVAGEPRQKLLISRIKFQALKLFYQLQPLSVRRCSERAWGSAIVAFFAWKLSDVPTEQPLSKCFYLYSITRSCNSFRPRITASAERSS